MVIEHNILGQMRDLEMDDYCVLGLATCFVRREQTIKQVQVVEPIASATLETLMAGIPTSYNFACAKSLRDIGQNLADFPATAQLCENFTERLMAAARTYKNNESAKNHIPVNTCKRDFNFSLDKKRILNLNNVVTAEDNIKQHAHTHKVL